MRFALSEDQQLLCDSTKSFLASESPTAVSRQIAESGGEGFSREHWAKLAALGYLGLVADTDNAGQGMGAVELAIVCEQMGGVCFPGPYLDVVRSARVLELAGGQETLVRKMVAGEVIVVTAIEHRVWPSDAQDVHFDDGSVRGTTYFVPYGASADYLVVTTPGGLVLAEGPFRSEPMEIVDEAARFARVELDNPAFRLGENALVDATADLLHVAIAADALGICQWGLDATVRYANERRTFGRPIGSYQVLQHRMADMLVQTESSRAAVYRAAWCLDNATADARLAAAAARAYAVASACCIMRDAVQIHGGNGFTWEFDIHRYLKRAITHEQQRTRAQTVLAAALDAFETMA